MKMGLHLKVFVCATLPLMDSSFYLECVLCCEVVSHEV